MYRIFSEISRSFVSIGMATALLTGGGTLAGLVSGTIPAAFAQDQPSGGAPPTGPHGNRMGKILLSLDLSDAQKAQIRGIIAEARKQNQGVTDPAQRRANFKAAYAKVDTVLTPAQRAEFHAKLDAMRQQNQSTHTQ